MNKTGLSKQIHPAAKWISYGSVAAYLILSILFFQERIVLRDGANFVTGMINSEGFYLPLHRYAAYVNQILPVIGIKAGASLSTIIFLYSLNISLFYLGIMLLLDRVYRNTRMMLGLAVFLWVLTYESFYMPVSELPLGIAFVFLWLAHLDSMSGSRSRKQMAVLLIITLHVIFSHPLILGVLLFLWLHFMFARDKGQHVSARVWMNTAILATGVLLLLKVLITGGGMYGDISKISKLENLLVNFKGLYLDQDANYYFKKYLTTSHLNGLLVLVFLNVVMILRKEYRLLFILDLCCGLFTIIYLITHPEFHVRLNMEIYFMVVAFYLAYCMARLATINDQTNSASITLAATSILLIVQITRVALYSGFFKERNAIMVDVIEQMDENGIQKAVVPFYPAPMKKVMFIGAIGNESLLLSKLQDSESGHTSASHTFVFVLADSVSEDQLKSLAGAPEDFLNNEWEIADLSNYDLDYFGLDRSSTYQVFHPSYPD